MTETQEHWRSRAGFMLAALGSAVGLGNVWRFSYVAGENGGGAFLLIYLAMVLLVGVPLLLGEFALGRSMRQESSSAVAMLLPKGWRHLGLLGVFASVLILAYYAVIAGWVLRYLGLYLFNTTHVLTEPGFAIAFQSHIAQPIEPFAWQFLSLALTLAIIVRGVEKGIERITKVLLPALGVLLLALAIHSTSLPGFGSGVSFLFQPDWSALTKPGVYVAALGQAFFSIGLAMGVMVAYGSYLPASQRLPGAALTVALGDALFALVAGLVVFAAVFSFNLDPAQGPGLAFVVLPEVFARMPGGALVGAAFFLLLTLAALTSMVSLLEVQVAFAMQRLQWSRRKASWILAGLAFLLGMPASLGYGLWSEVILPDGQGILDMMDFFAVELLLPLNGLLLALLLGWLWPAADALGSANLGAGLLGKIWLAALRYLIPFLLAVVLVSSFS